MSRGPENECGITVAGDQLLARSANRVLVLRSLVLYSDGAVMTLAVLGREAFGADRDDILYAPGPGDLRVGYGFDPGGAEPARRSLLPASSGTGDGVTEVVRVSGGDGDRGLVEAVFWVAPVRGSAFVISTEWAKYDVSPTRVSIGLPSVAERTDRLRNLWA
jgi:hypothetical protein